VKRIEPENWTIADSAELYGIERWGQGYFGLSDKGEIEIQAPFASGKARVALVDIIDGMNERGINMPLLLRVENILDDRIKRLNEAFARAIAAAGYQNVYRGVFPIKVNQQCHVVEEVARFGQRYQHGLEAGTKAELIIALSTLRENDGYIVCNGYKDEEFVDLGLHAVQLGIKCFFVVETLAELPIIINRSRALGVKPLIGVRLKLSEKVDGHWNEDSGDRSLFGLTSRQLIELVDHLKSVQMLDCLQLLHYHLGSQIPNIRNIRVGALEACRYYVDLVGEGAPMGHLDIGGGLAVDYDGSQMSGSHSKNYRLSEYCIDVVEAVMETLDPLDIPHPVLISESGRATVAHASILLFNVLDVSHFDAAPLPDSLPDDAHELIHNLFHVLRALSERKLQECYNDAHHYRDEVRELFRRGQVNLRSRALAENIFLEVMQRIVALLGNVERVPAELEDLEESLADIYYCNFSVFQSLPDTWAIEQVFPVMPVHRLQEKPTRQAIIGDLTCDCDGKIDRFIGERKTLPLHPLQAGENYFLGVFLVGAYQETLGDLHNLFGDTNVVSVRINEDSSFDFLRELEGDTIADVLSYVEYQPRMMFERFRETAEEAVRRGKITVAERQRMLDAFSESMRGYTYYED
jgi:arginine decarboxylase